MRGSVFGSAAKISGEHIADANMNLGKRLYLRSLQLARCQCSAWVSIMSRINSLSILVIAVVWMLSAIMFWHEESQCGLIVGRVCRDLILEWIKWVILLRWVAPYQTLIAGMAAVLGALGAIHAAKLTIFSSRDSAEQAARQQAGVDAAYLSEFFRQSSHLQIHTDFKAFIERWSDVQSIIKRMIVVNPEFSVDCLYVWGRVCDAARSRPTYLGIASLGSQAAIAAFVLDDISKFHLETTTGKYGNEPLACSGNLRASLNEKLIFAQNQNIGASSKGLADRMLRYIRLPES